MRALAHQSNGGRCNDLSILAGVVSKIQIVVASQLEFICNDLRSQTYRAAGAGTDAVHKLLHNTYRVWTCAREPGIIAGDRGVRTVQFDGVAHHAAANGFIRTI